MVKCKNCRTKSLQDNNIGKRLDEEFEPRCMRNQQNNKLGKIGEALQ